MWLQQGLHLLQFTGTPPLSSRLGSNVSFGFRILVKGLQESRGVGEIVRFLLMPYQNRYQDTSGHVSAAPDLTITWDEFLGNIHQSPRSSPFVPSRWPSIRTHEGQCVVGHDRTSPAERFLYHPLIRPIFDSFHSSIYQGVLISQGGRQGHHPPTWQCRSNHSSHQSESLCRGSFVGRPGDGTGGAVASGDFLFPIFSVPGTLPSHFFLSLMFVVCASPRPVFILPQ